MSKICYKFLLFTFWLSISSYCTNDLSAQEVLPINLQTVLELGAADNLTIQAAQMQNRIEEANVIMSKEWWIPDLYVGSKAHRLSGAAFNTDGRFAIDIDRDNLWLGLGLDVTWDFADGIYKTKTAKLKSQAREYQSIEERNLELLGIIDTYYKMMASQLYYRTYEVLADASSTMADQLEIQVESGLQYQSDLLLSKSNLNHLKVQMLQSKMQYELHSASLVELLNLDPAVKLVAVDTVLAPHMLNDLELVNETNSFQTIYETHPSVLKQELNIKTLELERKSQAMGFLVPEFTFNTYASKYGSLDGTLLALDPVAFPQTQQLYGTQALNLSLMWEIPIENFTTRGRIKKYDAQIGLEELQGEQIKSRINREILSSQASVTNASEQMELAREGSQYAEEALSQSLQRQELGTNRPLELLQAQEVFLKSKLDYLNAVSNYNIAQYRLYVAKGNNL